MPDVCDDNPSLSRQTYGVPIAGHYIWRSVGKREKPILPEIPSYLWPARSFTREFVVHCAGTRTSSDDVPTRRKSSEEEGDRHAHFRSFDGKSSGWLQVVLRSWSWRPRNAGGS